MARRLMYWQAYLHKTSVVAEMTLTKILKRAKELSQKGIELSCNAPLLFFINNKITLENFDDKTLETFALLDDFDVMSAIKNWQFHSDFVLNSLCKMILNRDLLKIVMLDEKQNTEKLTELRNKFALLSGISDKEAAYFVFKGKLKNIAYNKESEPISILKKDKTVEDIIDTSDQLQLKALSKSVTKYYMCFQLQLI